MFADVSWLWNCFQLLSETREYGFGGPLRIKFTELKSLLELRGINREDDIELALRIIPTLDGIWLENHYHEAEAKKKQSEARRK